MKKNIILICCILLFSSSASAADQPDNTGTKLQLQKMAATQYSGPVDPDGDPAVLQAMARYQFRHENIQRIRDMIQQAKRQELPAVPFYTQRTSENALPAMVAVFIVTHFGCRLWI